jgi:hypothetical protein
MQNLSPQIFADERRSKAKAFTAKNTKERKGGRSGQTAKSAKIAVSHAGQVMLDSFLCFNLSPQHQAVIYVEHGNLD